MWSRKWHPLSSIPALRLPWTEEAGRLQSVGSQRLGHNWCWVYISQWLFSFCLLWCEGSFLGHTVRASQCDWRLSPWVCEGPSRLARGASPSHTGPRWLQQSIRTTPKVSLPLISRSCSPGKQILAKTLGSLPWKLSFLNGSKRSYRFSVHLAVSYDNYRNDALETVLQLDSGDLTFKAAFQLKTNVVISVFPESFCFLFYQGQWASTLRFICHGKGMKMEE